ncbi:MAG: hypothetical protein UEL26_14315 [Segatella copri]|nr:hypothetical protein [Segatella copri]
MGNFNRTGRYNSMFEMLIFGLGIFELKLATLEPELAILLGIFESKLGIFGLKLATLEPELAILLGIFEPKHVILESELATLRNRSLQYPSVFSSIALF